MTTLAQILLVMFVLYTFFRCLNAFIEWRRLCAADRLQRRRRTPEAKPQRTRLLIPAVLLVLSVPAILGAAAYFGTNEPSNCSGMHPMVGGGCSWGRHCEAHCPHAKKQFTPGFHTGPYTNAPHLITLADFTNTNKYTGSTMAEFQSWVNRSLKQLSDTGFAAGADVAFAMAQRGGTTNDLAFLIHCHRTDQPHKVAEWFKHHPVAVR